MPCEETDDLEKVIEHLSDGNHMVIASMSQGHFTRGGHLIVLVGVTKEGNENRFIVYDPNRENPNYGNDGAVLKTDATGFNGIVTARVSVIS